MLICREICFVAIYAVVAQNLFCRDLRTFVWRKIYSEIVLVEKKDKYQVCLWCHMFVWACMPLPMSSCLSSLFCHQVYPEQDPKIKTWECEHFWGKDSSPKADWVHFEELGGYWRVQCWICWRESTVLADVFKLSKVKSFLKFDPFLLIQICFIPRFLSNRRGKSCGLPSSVGGNGL